MGVRLQTDAETGDLPENHEINVTPFIDVMLVLLIIFMVAAPLATVSINVDLPSASATSTAPTEPVYVTLTAGLSLSVGEQAVADGELEQALLEATGGDPEQRLFLRADEAVAYGDIMALMDRLRNAGYLKVALVGLEKVAR